MRWVDCLHAGKCTRLTGWAEDVLDAALKRQKKRGFRISESPVLVSVATFTGRMTCGKMDGY